MTQQCLPEMTHSRNRIGRGAGIIHAEGVRVVFSERQGDIIRAEALPGSRSR